MMLRYSTFLVLLSGSAILMASSTESAGRFSRKTVDGYLDRITLHYINAQTHNHYPAEVSLDELVNEAIWQEVTAFDNMLVSIPGTEKPGHYSTENRLLATEKRLYLNDGMYQPTETIVMRMTKRDDHTDRDTYGVTLAGRIRLLVCRWPG